MTTEMDPRMGEPLMTETGPIRPGAWTPNEWGLPSESECPVEVLGKDGGTLWVIDADGDLRSLGANSFNMAMIQSLFGDRLPWLYWTFPRWDLRAPKLQCVDGPRTTHVVGCSVDEVRAAFWKAGFLKGKWSPTECVVRGLGVWQTEAGRLVIHCGDRLVVGKEWKRPGHIDGALYPVRAAIPVPPCVDVPTDVGKRVLAALESFAWAKRDGAALALGMIGAMLVSAALPWRPHAFVEGACRIRQDDPSRLISEIVGPIVVRCSSPSVAGLLRCLDIDGRPLVIDGGDYGDGSRFTVLSLARCASKGEAWRRGSPDGQASERELRSCFLFDMGAQSPLEDEDYGFLALSLRRIEWPTAHPMIEAVETIGPLLLRRIVDRWADVLAIFERLKADGGKDGSAISPSLAIVSALAGVMLSDDPDSVRRIG